MVQGIKVREVGNLRCLHDGDVDIPHHMIAGQVLEGNGVLIVDTQLIQVRNDPEHRDSRLFFQERKSRFQKGNIAPELVDYKALHKSPFFRFQKFQCPHDGSQGAAPVDIGDKEYRRMAFLCNPHVHDIILFEVHFRRAAGPFDDESIEMGFHVVQALLHRIPGPLAVAVLVFRSAVIAYGLAEENDLGAGIAGGLQEHRIHLHNRKGPRSFRLGYCGPADFTARQGDVGIQRHILGLEGGRLVAILGKDPAECGGEDTLAYMGTGSLKHYALSNLCHYSSTPLSLSSMVIPAMER